jgi:hypothetical protein
MGTRQRILLEEEIQDVDQIKNYITKSFNRKKTRKSNKLYINLCNIYELYPAFVENILDNMPNIGYYKDYFHILSFSNNYKLNNYIYSIVIKQVTEDLDNLKINKQISTIGKWLPKEGSKIDRKIKFVDKFNVLVWGKSSLSKFHFRKKYRQMRSMLNEKLGTLESLMCTKQYDKIDLNKVSMNAVQRHKTHLLTHPEMVPKYHEFQVNKLTNMNLFDFVKEIGSPNYDGEIMEQVWNEQNYHVLIPYINQHINNMICVVDMSKDMFTNNAHYLSIGIALLVDKFSSHKNKVIIGKDIIQFDTNSTLSEKKNKILKYSGPCAIDILQYQKLININDDYVLLVITDKQVKMPELGTYIKFIPYYDGNYDIELTVNNKCRKVTKYDDVETTQGRIQTIINTSSELHNTNYIYYIALSFMCWVFLKFLEVIFGPKQFNYPQEFIYY